MTRDGTSVGKIGVSHGTDTASIALDGRLVIARTHELEGAVGAGGSQEDFTAISQEHLDRSGVGDPRHVDRDEGLTIEGADGTFQEVLISGVDLGGNIFGDPGTTKRVGKEVGTLVLGSSHQSRDLEVTIMEFQSGGICTPVGKGGIFNNIGVGSIDQVDCSTSIISKEQGRGLAGTNSRSQAQSDIATLASI